MARGYLDGLNSAQLAAVASVFTFEARRAEAVPPAPPPAVLERLAAIEHLAIELVAAERSAGLPEATLPEVGFAASAYAWAAGHDLEELFEDDDMAAGDFVRNCRQLIDVLRQLRAGFPRLVATAGGGGPRHGPGEW